MIIIVSAVIIFIMWGVLKLIRMFEEHVKKKTTEDILNHNHRSNGKAKGKEKT